MENKDTRHLKKYLKDTSTSPIDTYPYKNEGWTFIFTENKEKNSITSPILKVMI